MQYTKTNIKAIIAGTGGEAHSYQSLIDQLDLNHKVQLIGNISQQEKFDFYAHALAIVFPPVDEDYGYITLETMLSSKPTITCHDSGGVLEFITHQESGFIIEPNPQELAQKLDWLYHNKSKAEEIGKNARESYLQKNISWGSVVNRLLEE
jgi:glycosyltransferase involved in cell wall biosynthesis